MPTLGERFRPLSGIKVSEHCVLCVACYALRFRPLSGIKVSEPTHTNLNAWKVKSFRPLSGIKVSEQYKE